MFNRTDLIFLFLGLALVIFGSYWGLVVAPPEEFMGDVYRVLYAHVPAGWTTFIAYTVSFVASTTYLLRSSERADRMAEASAEVGIVFNIVLLISGAIWARPTWGIWWTWDPRLTSAAIMFFMYVGYLALRAFVDEPEKRATWAAVVAILIFVNIPIVWYSVKWWNTIHQLQSSPKTIPNSDMKLALRCNAFAFLAFFIFFVRVRMRIAALLRKYEGEYDEPPPRAEPTISGGVA